MIPFKDDNPTRTVPFVTYGLIAANTLVFGYMLMLGEQGLERFALEYSVIPARSFPKAGAMGSAALVTPFSSLFIHGGLVHIAGNMLYLWIFGDNVEDVLGHLRYLIFYLGCGLAAVMTHSIMYADSTLPMMGASGAVSGVLAAYMVLYPRAGVWTLVLVFVVRVPAIIIIGLWILLQLSSGMSAAGQEAGGVAWFAHIGGFSAGLVLLYALGGKSGIRPGRGYRST